MSNQSNDRDPEEGTPTNTGYSRFWELEESVFPNNEGDYASSFMRPHGPSNELARRTPAANPPPWSDPDQAWRYDGGHVYTGEGFKFSRRTQPQNTETMSSSRRPVASQPGDLLQGTGRPQVPSPLQEGQNSLPPRGPQGFGAATIQGLQSSGTAYGVAPQGAAAPQNLNEQSSSSEKNKFNFVSWNDEAKRTLYRWKRVLKKGPPAYVHHFPGETVESLRDAWDKYGDEGKRLHEEWVLARGGK